MKVDLNEKVEKLFTLMEGSNSIPLKKFVYDIKSFKAASKIRSKNVCVFPGFVKEYKFKDNSYTYGSSIRYAEKEDDTWSISLTSTVDTKKLASSTLTVSGNECKLAIVDGKIKENYTFKFTSKRVYQIKEIKPEKTK